VPADVILYALIAAGLIIWLRSLLGMRQDGERQRPNPFVEAENAASPGQAQGQIARPKTGLLPDGTVDMTANLGRNMSIGPAAQAGLMDIARADRGFEVGHFLTGAQDAFVMIVEAFARGDRATLRNLLSEPVFKSFDAALGAREKSGEKASVEIHAVRRAEIVNACLQGRNAFVTVRFVADETNVLHDAAGKLLSGSPDRVAETIDIWTFTRDLRSRAPGWFLCETRDEAPVDATQKIVPDARQGDSTIA
jgi:predicted lipid-binding transport protein (Tim44 family)